MPPIELALPDLAAPSPDLGRAEAGRDLAAPMPCSKPPCAALPIVLLHGYRGSNDDWQPMIDALIQTDGRYDGSQESGLDDHPSWSARSIDRRSWLFAFDYYIRHTGDGRDSYTAGPGKIGSDSAFACPGPVAGLGHVVADSAAYDTGTIHDYAADLADFVASVLRATGASEVDVVAHSMGGLVLRSYLSFHGGAAQVRRVLLLASPVEGVDLAAFAKLLPLGHPDWMEAHEQAEIDGGSIASTVHFSRCGESGQPGPWAVQLTDHEKLQPPAVELHVITALLDPSVPYWVGDHPLALSHKTVLATHAGTLSHSGSIAEVKALLGGTYGAAGDGG